MGTTKEIWSPEAQQFVGVYSPWDESVGAFVVHLATSDDRVEVTFRYHAGCERDRQASGWTDWTEWHTMPNPDLDAAMEAAGVVGHIGDRATFTYRGRPFMLIEGETTPGDWAS